MDRETDLGQPLLDGLALLHPGEVVVVQRHVRHDGLLIWMRDHHVLYLQQLHDPKLPLRQREGVFQITPRVIAADPVVVKEVGPGVERERRRNRGPNLSLGPMTTKQEVSNKPVSLSVRVCVVTGVRGSER